VLFRGKKSAEGEYLMTVMWMFVSEQLHVFDDGDVDVRLGQLHVFDDGDVELHLWPKHIRYQLQKQRQGFKSCARIYINAEHVCMKYAKQQCIKHIHITYAYHICKSKVQFQCTPSEHNICEYIYAKESTKRNSNTTRYCLQQIYSITTVKQQVYIA
jgi:hypothetical protein